MTLMPIHSQLRAAIAEFDAGHIPAARARVAALRRDSPPEIATLLRYEAALLYNGGAGPRISAYLVRRALRVIEDGQGLER